MTSSKEDEAAAAAEQLGSMSLGESVERKDNETEPTTNNGTPTKLCSACGEKSDTVKKCTACKCVWYCDKECQDRHRKEHRKECKRIKKELDKRGGKLDLGTEKDVGPLGKVPPRDECPICMRVFPLSPRLQNYHNCCGKAICAGCDFEHQIRSQKEQADAGQTPKPPTCAFCRIAVPQSDEEVLARLIKRVERKDPQAMCNVSFEYRFGGHGLPVDQAKCIDLLRQSADLGYPPAQDQLGFHYQNGEMGLEQNGEEATKYWEKAAEGGHVIARQSLGSTDFKNGDHIAAMRHWRLSASAGFRNSMEALIACFERGLLHHTDLSEITQAFYLARDEMRSKNRDIYVEYLKMKGEHNKKEHDL